MFLNQKHWILNPDIFNYFLHFSKSEPTISTAEAHKQKPNQQQPIVILGNPGYPREASDNPQNSNKKTTNPTKIHISPSCFYNIYCTYIMPNDK